MKRLDRYIMLNHLLGMVPVLFLLTALFSLITLADELEEVGQGAFRLPDAFAVVLYTAPRRIIELLPATALIGGLVGLGALANHQELIAARVAGMSRARMAVPVVYSTLIAGLLVLAGQSWLVPLSEREASQLRSKALEGTSLDASSELEFWTLSGESIIHVRDVLFNRVLLDVEVFETDATGRLLRLIQAQQARIGGGADWVLEDVTITELDVAGAHDRRVDTLEWPQLISEEQARLLILPLESLAPTDLLSYIRYMDGNGLDTHRFRVILWQQIGLVLSVVAMGLLSLPLLTGSTRQVSAAQRVVLGGAFGIAFFLVQQLTGHLAGLFRLNPPLIIMTPVLILLAISVIAQFWSRHGEA